MSSNDNNPFSGFDFSKFDVQKMLGDFKRERDRIDGIMAKAPNATRIAGQ